jgi:hypothetical protein
VNPIILAALHGYAKGYAIGGDASGGLHPTQSMIMGPIREEMSYRGPLSYAAPGFADYASAAAFAFAHFNAAEPSPMRNMRMLDAFAGGLIYASAFREYGLVGAIAAHALHNVMTTAGANQRNRSGR